MRAGGLSRIVVKDEAARVDRKQRKEERRESDMKTTMREIHIVKTWNGSLDLGRSGVFVFVKEVVKDRFRRDMNALPMLAKI